ncbi:hypothetical protein LVQ79_13965 [Buttiauxella sp. A2-C1_F]|uniref:hypothetical protein n=1 Tax=unclassified Buttiauxella TaxID=2634062 RepID=UPI001E2BF121|nr:MULTISPECIES: hypothetical protein [unclassified Buttiauxella]MCE0813353.1 hypothetical protein [Buttiauxella sp. S04-F03]MCE0846659.1 hypothetical protein [Buttiauxella sp. A2-C1_F]
MKKTKNVQIESSEQLHRKEKQNRQGWLAGLFSLLYTIFAVIFNEYSNYVELKYLQTPVEFLVIALLTYLIFIKSKIGAVLMVIYFATHKIILLLSGLYFSVSNIIIDVVLFYCYLTAAREINFPYKT